MNARGSAAPRRWASAAALVSVLALSACGNESPAPLHGGAAAPDKMLTKDLEINSLQLAFPQDGLYQKGDDATLDAAFTNIGTAKYRLVDVQGPDFRDARLVARDGTQGAIPIAPDDNVYLEPQGPPSVVLLGLDRPLHSSQAIEVTFVFQNGGRVTAQVPVAPEAPADGTFQAPQDPTPNS